jgi:hypothetical protein
VDLPAQEQQGSKGKAKSLKDKKMRMKTEKSIFTTTNMSRFCNHSHIGAVV